MRKLSWAERLLGVTMDNTGASVVGQPTPMNAMHVNREETITIIKISNGYVLQHNMSTNSPNNPFNSVDNTNVTFHPDLDSVHEQLVKNSVINSLTK